MRRWYTEVGTKWLRKRIRPWAARLSEESVTVEVRDLGFRRGSARPHPGPQHINIHWATLQLPQASSTTSSSTNSPTSARRTTPPSSGPSSTDSCPVTRPTRPPSPPSASTSGLAKAVDGQGRAARTAGVRLRAATQEWLSEQIHPTTSSSWS